MKDKILKTEFEILKQIMLDLSNLNATLGLMNLHKFFPSSRVQKSVSQFFRDRKKFAEQGDKE